MPTSPAPGNDDVDLTAAIRAAQEGDEDAFRLLYRAIHPGLIRYLWAHAGDAAEDLAAETWLRVSRDLGKFRGDEAGFRGWVTTIGRHRVLDYLRQESRQPPGGAPVELLAHLPAAEDTEGAVLEALATADALEMIAGLPSTQAEAVLLTVVVQLDAKTAGKVMGKRAGAVRVATHRGLRRLASELGVADGGAASADGASADAVSADGARADGAGADGTRADGGGAGAAEGTSGRRIPQQPQRRVTSWPGATVKDVR